MKKDEKAEFVVEPSMGYRAGRFDVAQP